MRPIHHAADRGFSSAAGTYARGRPDYPAAIARWLESELGLTRDRLVLDLGAGTGKFVPSLLATGARVVAVEPVAAMREELARAHPAVESRAGTAEAIPLADGTVDAVVCAQAFHWFATAAALAEIRRVLRPGGTLGLVWNVRDESVDWVAALTDIMRPHEGDAPRFHRGDWRRPFPAPGFTPLERHGFAYRHVGTPQEVIVDRILSVSFIAALPADARAGVEARIRALIAATPALAGRAEIAFPYETLAFACRKRD